MITCQKINKMSHLMAKGCKTASLVCKANCSLADDAADLLS